MAATRVPVGGDRACSGCNEGSRRRGLNMQPLQRPLRPVGIEHAAAATTTPAGGDRACSRCNVYSRWRGSSLQRLQRAFPSTGIELVAAATSPPGGGDRACSGCNEPSRRREPTEQPLQRPLPPTGAYRAAISGCSPTTFEETRLPPPPFPFPKSGRQSGEGNKVELTRERTDQTIRRFPAVIQRSFNLVAVF